MTQKSLTASPICGSAAIFAEGAEHLPIVVGDFALTIAAIDGTHGELSLEWLDARSGKPARPTAADLAGSIPVAGQADLAGGDVATLLSPDGRHLFVQWSTEALIVDVDAGTVQLVASDFGIRGDAIDDTTVYGTTENGSVTIDLASAVATPLDEGTLAVTDVVGDTAVLAVPSDGVSKSDQLIVAHRP